MGRVTLYKPHEKQLQIHNALDADGVFYCIVPIGRQFGKSLLGMNQAIKWALENPDSNVGWISPTYKQCKKVFRQMLKGMNDCPFVDSENKSDLIIDFDNGSQIVFYSAEAYDTIRGESFHYVVCDEFRYFPNDAWSEGIKPTLTVTGKKALIISTPKGKGLFYQLYQLANSEDRYISFTGTSYDNPYANKDEIEDARRNLPDHIFRQEYLAEFLDDGSGVFININEAIREGKKTDRTYAGVDLGRADDYTVLTITNSDDDELYCERWRQQEWSSMVSKIVNKLNEYQPYTMVESNGTQDAIYEMIRNGVNYSKGNIQPFVTTNKSKASIIEDLAVGFENGEVGILGHEFQTHELGVFSYEYNPRTRTIKYEAPSGLHDDYVMSRALATHARKKGKSSGRYTIR